LVVYLHGAVGNGRFPYYNGLSIAKELEKHTSFLLISDPLNSLYDGDFRCSWYTSPYPEEEIIGTIAQNVKETMESIGANRVLFISGSAGGIPLMKLGRHINDACFFIWNPQTNICKFYKSHVNRWCNALRIDQSFRDVLEASDSPTSVNLNFKSYFENKSNHYFILQMLEDGHHIKMHMTPFYEALSGKKANFTLDSSELVLSNILIHIGAWSHKREDTQGRITGHVAPKRSLQVNFIKDFISSSDPKKDFDEKYFRKWDVREK
jgi:hypothetical protein